MGSLSFNFGPSVFAQGGPAYDEVADLERRVAALEKDSIRRYQLYYELDPTQRVTNHGGVTALVTTDITVPSDDAIVLLRYGFEARLSAASPTANHVITPYINAVGYDPLPLFTDINYINSSSVTANAWYTIQGRPADYDFSLATTPTDEFSYSQPRWGSFALPGKEGTFTFGLAVGLNVTFGSATLTTRNAFLEAEVL